MGRRKISIKLKSKDPSDLLAHLKAIDNELGRRDVELDIEAEVVDEQFETRLHDELRGDLESDQVPIADTALDRIAEVHSREQRKKRRRAMRYKEWLESHTAGLWSIGWKIVCGIWPSAKKADDVVDAIGALRPGEPRSSYRKNG